MIDVGCTDVTWSHAWNSAWVSSYRHFLVVCGRPFNIMGGIQRLLVLLAGVPVCSVLCLGPLVNLCEQLNCAGSRLPLDTLLQGKKPWVSFIVNNCSDIFIPPNPHPPTCFALRMTVCLSYFSFPDGLTFILSLYLQISQSEMNKLCLPSTLVEVTHWKSNVLLFVSRRHIEARMLGKKSDAPIRDLGRVKAEVEGLEYLFLPPHFVVYGELGRLAWTNIPLCFTICPFRDVQVPLHLKGHILIGTWMIHHLGPKQILHNDQYLNLKHRSFLNRPNVTFSRARMTQRGWSSNLADLQSVSIQWFTGRSGNVTCSQLVNSQEFKKYD